MNARSYVIITAAAVLSLLPAGRSLHAQQLYTTLICHVENKKIVHLEFID